MTRKRTCTWQTKCDEAWKPERRRCIRRALNGRLCIHAEGHERVDNGDGEAAAGAQAAEVTCRCDSGVAWLSASGCGRLQRLRAEPFSLLEANHLFYQECEEGEDVLPPSHILPLCAEAGACAAAEHEDEPPAVEAAGAADGEGEDGGLACRVYVLGSREEFLQGGLQVCKCLSACVYICVTPSRSLSLLLSLALSLSLSLSLVCMACVSVCLCVCASVSVSVSVSPCLK